MRLRKYSEARRARSGGNSLVELSMTLVPTLALLMGIFDIGIMQFRWLTLQNAVREGCRYAVTFQTGAGLGQDASIESVVQQYALGLVKSSDSPATIFVNYYSPSALTTAISCDTHLSTCTSSSGGNVPGNVVVVSVRAPFSWIAPLSGTTRNGTYASGAFTLSPSSGDVLGGYPVGVSSVTR